VEDVESDALVIVISLPNMTIASMIGAPVSMSRTSPRSPERGREREVDDQTAIRSKSHRLLDVIEADL
jgi:hypothetical protein